MQVSLLQCYHVCNEGNGGPIEYLLKLTDEKENVLFSLFLHRARQQFPLSKACKGRKKDAWLREIERGEREREFVRRGIERKEREMKDRGMGMETGNVMEGRTIVGFIITRTVFPSCIQALRYRKDDVSHSICRNETRQPLAGRNGWSSCRAGLQACGQPSRKESTRMLHWLLGNLLAMQGEEMRSYLVIEFTQEQPKCIPPSKMFTCTVSAN
ncbi:hypothetical protein PR048_026523 [Dryococelus australis]|uniref:Uncharacterized protein n=1 Tax=Dryococelus australis TaxID=614101 RepID=A0ABQ9GLM5_9NEOP|nr:hypothetical protein PR048_026523 [Dryococelus australis]